jgi:purine-cytosine permease-like protein
MNTAADPGHGHSPAAWTAVIVMLSALSVGTVAFFLGLWWLVTASVIATVVGWILGFLLAAMGWGAQGPKYQPKEH